MLKNILTRDEFEDLKTKVSLELLKFPVPYQKKTFEILETIALLTKNDDEKMNALIVFSIALVFIDRANDKEKEKASTND